MLHRLVLASALCLAIDSALCAPVAGTATKKEPAAEEKKKAVATDSHVVKRGETLWGIARLHGVSVGDIMDLNHLNDSTLRDGQTLKIPRPESDPALAPTKATTHTIAKGESLRSIARKYGLTQEDLERANPKIDPAAPKAGSKLTIPATVSVTEKSSPIPGGPAPPVTLHIVTEKDTFHTIARKYGTTERAIAAANPDVNPDRLRPGSKVIIPHLPKAAPKDNDGSSSSGSKSSLIAPAAKKTIASTVADEAAGRVDSPTSDKPKPKSRRYVVSADETAQTISEAFNVSVGKLHEMNGLKPGSPIKAGMEIQVPILAGEGPGTSAR